MGRSLRGDSSSNPFLLEIESGIAENSEFLDASYKIPGGGWSSSADDMANLEIAILADRFSHAKPATQCGRRSNPARRSGCREAPELCAGLGYGKSTGVANVGHDGGQQGTSTAILLVPEQRMGVVVLANMDSVDASALAGDVMKLLVGATTQGK